MSFREALPPTGGFFNGCPLYDRTMPAYFTSGWFGNSEPAWHGEGIVTPGTLPAREAFEKADALFQVEKRELVYPDTPNESGIGSGGITGYQPSGQYAIVRCDNNQFLGAVTKRYEVVQNEALLRMAEFLREEVDLDTVVVLQNGSKLAFTATIKGAQKEVIPGDTVKRRIVGFLGHDGITGVGAMFTNVRVVCSNTLALAERTSRNMISLRHTNGVNNEFNKLIQSINVQREVFEKDIEDMRFLANRIVKPGEFRSYLEILYKKDLYIPEDLMNGTEAGYKDVTEYGKTRKMILAREDGLGVNIPGVKGTWWAAVNAVTEVETSTKQKRTGAQFYKANFGSGLTASKKAMDLALDFASTSGPYQFMPQSVMS